ncbi:TPA: hypothetical protein ACGO6G_002086, partial [Streptococcus suis]
MGSLKLKKSSKTKGAVRPFFSFRAISIHQWRKILEFMRVKPNIIVRKRNGKGTGFEKYNRGND